MMRRGPSVAGWLWLFVFALSSAFSGHNPKPGDSKLMCLAAQSLLSAGSLAIEPVRVDVTRGPNGSHYTKYPLMCVVQCVPALLLQRAAHALAPEDKALELWALGAVPHALTATLAVAMQLLGVALGGTELVATWLALIVVFCTPLAVAGRVLYSENLQAVLGVFALWAGVRARDARLRAPFLWAGAFCGLAINTKILWLALPLAILFDQAREPLTRARSARILCLAAPGLLLGMAAFVAYNQLRYGRWFAQGYDSERDGTLGFAVPFASGMYGLLFSSGKSVFAYAPMLIASLFALPHWWRARRRDMILIGIPALFTLCVTACWWAWSGDWAWGPRLIVPIIPLLAVPLLQPLASRSRWTGVLAASGLIIQLLGMSIDPGHFLQLAHPASLAVAGRQALDELRDDMLPVHFVPELNPIRGQAWLLTRYLTQPGWDKDSDYPWKSLGIKSWRPHGDPTPPRLDLWLDAAASGGAWALELTLLSVALASAVLLWRRLRGRQFA